MDTKGARELARLLEARNGSMPEPVPPPPVMAADAAPIFHWFGIEPDGTPAAEAPVEEDPGADPAST